MTIAQSLVDKYNFVHINIDQLKWDLGYAKVGDENVPDQVWTQIFLKADKLIT